MVFYLINLTSHFDNLIDLKVVLNNSNEIDRLIEEGETFVLKISKEDCSYCDEINLIEKDIFYNGLYYEIMIDNENEKSRVKELIKELKVVPTFVFLIREK